MNKTRAIIVEDEPQARQMLKTLLQDYCEDIQVIGEAKNVKEGVAVIQQLLPDLVFLDVEMPGEKGLKLFNYFDAIDFEVIFTTAYDQYAINALRLHAIDYLLKPIDIKELRIALAEFEKRQKNKQVNQALRYQMMNEKTPAKQRMVLPCKEGFVFVDVEDIMYCEADSNYTIFVTTDNQKHWVSKTIKEYVDLLEDFGFIRVHRSYIINPEYVIKFVKTRPSSIVMKDDSTIVISKRKRNEVLQRLLEE